MAHTPGPWTLHLDSIPYVNCGEAGPAFGPVVMAGSVDEMMANARLIAAAPDLLEACKAMMQWVEQRPQTHPYDGWELARAAIAKAEGG
jgi:hypothetical protein